MKTITINGRTPSKKNSRNIFVRYGKIMNIPSADYKEWLKDALQQMRKQEKRWQMQTYYLITLVFYAGDRRKFDLSNKAESVMDMLVDGGYIADDNYEVVPELILKFGGYEKDKARCEIIIN